MGLRQDISIGARAVTGLVAGRGRYLRALGTFGELVAVYTRRRVAPSEARSLEDTHRYAAGRVTELCRRNGASWVKAAQFFSVRPDILPREYIESLQELQNEAAPVHFDELKQALIDAWGKDWERHFSEFDLVPVATASIAQVHRARLTSGEEVAVKIRLPEVLRLFDQDSRIFRLLARVAAPFFRELDIPQVVEQLLDMTSVELDFRNEAENMRRFARLPHPDGIRVPSLFAELSGPAVLVSGWEEGDRLRDYLDKHPEDANDLLGRLFASYLQQVTRFGMYQADPHPGNFIVNSQRELVILDFGAIGKLEPNEVRSYSRLLYGLMGFEGQVDIGELFIDAGFVGGSAETLRNLAMYVLSDKLKQSRPTDAMAELLQLFRENHISIPDSYIGIARVLITIGGFLMNFDVPFDWTPPERRRVSNSKGQQKKRRKSDREEG